MTLFELSRLICSLDFRKSGTYALNTREVGHHPEDFATGKLRAWSHAYGESTITGRTFKGNPACSVSGQYLGSQSSEFQAIVHHVMSGDYADNRHEGRGRGTSILFT